MGEIGKEKEENHVKEWAKVVPCLVHKFGLKLTQYLRFFGYFLACFLERYFEGGNAGDGGKTR